MTSIERHEARYQRRKAERQRKKDERLKEANDFDKVFSYGNLYRAYQHCRKGVSWKASVQKYITQAPLEVYRTYKKLQDGTFRSPGFYEFDICERGKVRHIRSNSIKERVVQNCLCDNTLIPALQRTFVYDNGASTKNKGYTFTIDRITEDLRRHFRKYGNEGYILIYDFSKFFDNVSHAIAKRIISSEITDERILKLAYHFIDAFGSKGLGLGSQISQVLALASANKLDHVVKEICRIKMYARYMDDGRLISKSKEKLLDCLDAIEKVCEALHIKLNRKKTQIVKLSHGFTWLKVKFYLTKTGKVIRKICRDSVNRERHKLKKLHKKLEEGRLTIRNVWDQLQSWVAYASNFNAYRTVKTMLRLFVDLFKKELNLNDLLHWIENIRKCQRKRGRNRRSRGYRKSRVSALTEAAQYLSWLYRKGSAGDTVSVG